MIVIYTSFKDEAEAKKIIRHLVESKLIACGNFYPVTSMYEWKGKIEEAIEMVSFLKAKKENFNKVKEEIQRMHSYDLPMIVRIDVDSNPEFKKWVRT